MNTELLKTFVAVARSESLSVAAESLSKTQSTITKSVQRLEEIIGGKLFNREGYRLSLNDRGKQLLNHAIGVIRSEQELLQLAKSINTNQLPNFTIAFDSIIPFATVAKFLDTENKFLSAYNVNMVSRVFDGAYKLVETGEANIALTAMLRESGQLEHVYQDELEIVNIVDSKYDGEYWREIPQCILTDETKMSTNSNILTISKKIHVQSIEQKFEIIKRGLAWGRVPVSLIEAATSNTSLVIKDAPGVYTHQKLPIYKVTSKNFYK